MSLCRDLVAQPAAPSAEALVPAPVTKPFRLPTDARPFSYHVHLRADPGKPTFSGRVVVELQLATPQDSLILHSRGLNLSRITVRHGAMEDVTGDVELDAETETAMLRFPASFGPGRAVLEIVYDGPVSAGMTGLYLSKDGAEECLVTQCEATDARAIFPCWDEPAFKATIQWSVTAPKGLTVLANGPETSRADLPGQETEWHFAPTPPIPTYLAAVAIGRFGSTPPVVAQKVPFRVLAMQGKQEFGIEARDAAVRLMPWFADYFGVPYRFGKYDQLAVPSFSFGAMENAGLVVFRASALLMDPATASWRDRRHITLVVSHEFAHQWFGNHVTMTWWDDLWLNESFAEWVAHKAVDALWPEHEVWIDFQARTNGALATDASAATHPIYQPVATPAEAAELFDAITYGKGSAVLRMLEAFLGPDAFCAGLRAYMERFGGANAKGDDLWRHLGQAAGHPVERIMGQWIRQAGHPVVRIESLGGGRLKLRQQRFRLLPAALGPASPETWDVPMVLRWRDDGGIHEQAHLLQGSAGEASLPLVGRLHWLHGNAGDVGFYRTDPDNSILDGLAAGLPDLTPAERVGLLRDQWGLVRSGARPPSGLFRLLESSLQGPLHYAVADTALAILREVERLLETLADRPALHAYRDWVRQAVAPAWAAIGPDPIAGEHARQGVLRAAIYRAMAGIACDPAALAAAIAWADREMADAASVDANLAGTVATLSAQAGDAGRFELHRNTYLARRDQGRSPQEAERHLGALASFRAPDLVGRALGLLLDGTVPKQSIGPILASMLREPHAQVEAWTHMQTHWATLRRELGDSWAASLAEATGSLPPARRNEVVGFLDAQAKDLVQSGKRAKAQLQERVELFASVVPALAAWAKAP